MGACRRAGAACNSTSVVHVSVLAAESGPYACCGPRPGPIAPNHVMPARFLLSVSLLFDRDLSVCGDLITNPVRFGGIPTSTGTVLVGGACSKYVLPPRTRICQIGRRDIIAD